MKTQRWPKKKEERKRDPKNGLAILKKKKNTHLILFTKFQKNQKV